MPTLLLMRHGKSDWSAGAPDHERPLNKRGTRAAGLMGQVLRSLGEAPDLVVTSSAVRARTTAELAMADGSFDVPCQVRDELYLPSVEDVIGVLIEVRDDVDRVLLVGHQPTWSQLLEALCGARVDFVTAAVAAVEVRTWADPRVGTLRWFLPPRRAERLVDA